MSVLNQIEFFNGVSFTDTKRVKFCFVYLNFFFKDQPNVYPLSMSRTVEQKYNNFIRGTCIETSMDVPKFTL